jgi:hypothetical protein
MAYTFTRRGSVTVVKVPYEGTLEQDFLLTADRHWDNPHSDWDMQRRHLDEAVKKGAGVLDFGDFFCAMQGKYDKRADKSSLRPEHQNGEYLDSLVDTGVDFFAPYATSFLRIARGNHETSIKGRHETDLIKRLVRDLNGGTGSKIQAGGYSGWVQFHFQDLITKRKDLVNLWYIHGYGGGGPVTKGTIQTARRAAYLPDAQVVVTGHIHEDWNLAVARMRIRPDGTLYKEDQLHVQVPTYKDEYGDGEGGWAVEGGMPPKPKGARWLLFRKGHDGAITYDTLKAK